jgi:hypothetical protein
MIQNCLVIRYICRDISLKLKNAAISINQLFKLPQQLTYLKPKYIINLT